MGRGKEESKLGIRSIPRHHWNTRDEQEAGGNIFIFGYSKYIFESTKLFLLSAYCVLGSVLGTRLVFYCRVTNDHKFSGFRHHPLMISQFCRPGSECVPPTGPAHLGSLGRISHVWNQDVC